MISVLEVAVVVVNVLGWTKEETMADSESHFSNCLESYKYSCPFASFLIIFIFSAQALRTSGKAALRVRNI